PGAKLLIISLSPGEARIMKNYYYTISLHRGKQCFLKEKKMGKKLIAVPAALGVAAVWFGSHAGAGFATGRQEVEYFVQFGWHAVWIGLFSMSILGFAIYNGLEFARLHKTYDYRSFFKKLYAPPQKLQSVPYLGLVLPTLWELLYLYAAILATGGVIAGASKLLNETLDIPYVIGVILIGGLLLVFTIFGAGLVRGASVFMAAFIILALIIVTGLGIKLGAANLGKVVAERTTRAGFPKILYMALLYGAFQSVLLAPIVSVSESLKSRKDTFLAAFSGFLVNGAMLVLVCIMLLSFFPVVIHKVLAVRYVTAQLGYNWLNVLYSLILFFAFISTGVGLIFGVVKRFETTWTKDSGFFKGMRRKRIAICLTCLLVSGGISLFGLTAIVAKGYGSLGLFSIFLTIIPLLFIAPFKNRKARKEKA
ncbi:MAG: hypothetical protein KAW12_00990, partial [Candidatus Aminicenantes bacterium]|nr:hypothetical protein [Candidatus Aminicenantes bacterium]